MTNNEADQLAQWREAASKMGREAGEAAASWCIDGNTSTEHVRRLVAMLDDGDPQAGDYLPPRPNLSGEWADSATPRNLYEDITGRDAHADASWNHDSYSAVLEVLCTAWEEGVSETFQPECERLLRAALPEPDSE